MYAKATLVNDAAQITQGERKLSLRVTESVGLEVSDLAIVENCESNAWYFRCLHQEGGLCVNFLRGYLMIINDEDRCHQSPKRPPCRS